MSDDVRNVERTDENWDLLFRTVEGLRERVATLEKLALDAYDALGHAERRGSSPPTRDCIQWVEKADKVFSDGLVHLKNTTPGASPKTYMMGGVAIWCEVINGDSRPRVKYSENHAVVTCSVCLETYRVALCKAAEDAMNLSFSVKVRQSEVDNVATGAAPPPKTTP